jgi:hypothetical protein
MISGTLTSSILTFSLLVITHFTLHSFHTNNVRVARHT